MSETLYILTQSREERTAILETLTKVFKFKIHGGEIRHVNEFNKRYRFEDWPIIYIDFKTNVNRIY